MTLEKATWSVGVPSSLTSSFGNPDMGIKVKLLDIKLCESYGDSLEWVRFWNRFSSLVGDRNDLDTVTKSAYLTQYQGLVLEKYLYSI